MKGQICLKALLKVHGQPGRCREGAEPLQNTTKAGGTIFAALWEIFCIMDCDLCSVRLALPGKGSSKGVVVPAQSGCDIHNPSRLLLLLPGVKHQLCKQVLPSEAEVKAPEQP